MTVLTASIARGLDADRLTRHGAAATLSLLEPAGSSARGYVLLATVLVGWTFVDGGFGQPYAVSVAESATVTAALVKRASAVSIGGNVFEVDPQGADRPRSAQAAVWTLYVHPTEQIYP